MRFSQPLTIWIFALCRNVLFTLCLFALFRSSHLFRFLHLFLRYRFDHRFRLSPLCARSEYADQALALDGPPSRLAALRWAFDERRCPLPWQLRPATFKIPVTAFL